MTKQSIDEIASTHLGRDSSGNLMASYTTPDSVDQDLLVKVPRCLNRTQYDIDDNNLPFIGYDIWNGYEFSTLTSKGIPVNGVIKIKYDANSKYIVESKSLKLYLNSFNMSKLGNTVESAIENSKMLISKQLSELLESDVMCNIFVSNKSYIQTENSMFNFIQLSKHFNSEKQTIDYNESFDILDTSQTGHDEFHIRCDALRSNCRVTNQPDWGDVFISYSGTKKVDLNSLYLYIISLRKENHFHEEICEMIYKRLLDKFSPNELFVGCLYTRRGGIDINPIRCNSKSLYDNCYNILSLNELSEKTCRQ